ncbi:putative transport protein YdiK [subsurface metagenome]
MNSEEKPPDSRNTAVLNTAVDLTIKIGTLLLIIFLCFRILLPFTNILLWAMVIAIIMFPLYTRLGKAFGKRKKLAAVLLAFVALSILLIPSYWLVDSLVVGLKDMADSLQDGSFELPPPSESVAGWPFIGEWLYGNWVAASQNLSQVLSEYLPQLRGFGEKVLNSLAGTGLGILQFALSIIIAAVFLTFSEDASRSSKKLFIKLAGENGEDFARVSEQTVRNVASGVIGVAIIQSTLIGVAMLIMDLPLAGVWIVVTLIFAIAQIPLLLVTIPVIIWLFAIKEPFPAVLWTIYLIVVGASDNYLKPVLMGKGASVPMLVIFLGAIGGFMAFGFLGLFLGAIILSLGYKLYLTWLDSD